MLTTLNRVRSWPVEKLEFVGGPFDGDWEETNCPEGVGIWIHKNVRDVATGKDFMCSAEYRHVKHYRYGHVMLYEPLVYTNG